MIFSHLPLTHHERTFWGVYFYRNLGFTFGWNPNGKKTGESGLHMSYVLPWRNHLLYCDFIVFIVIILPQLHKAFRHVPSLLHELNIAFCDFYVPVLKNIWHHSDHKLTGKPKFWERDWRLGWRGSASFSGSFCQYGSLPLTQRFQAVYLSSEVSRHSAYACMGFVQPWCTRHRGKGNNNIKKGRVGG